MMMMLVVAVEAGERKEAIAGALAEVLKLEESQRVEVGGVEMYRPGWLKVEGSYLGWVGETLMLVLNDPAGEAVGRLAGAQAGVERPGWVERLSAVPGAGDAIVYYVDVAGAWEGLRAMAEASGEVDDAEQIEAVLTRLGVEQVEYMAGRLGFAGEDIVGEGLLACEGREGLLGVLGRVDVRDFRYVDAEAVTATVARPDLGLAWDTVWGALEAALPEEKLAEAKGKISEVEEVLGFGIREELLGSLKGPVVLYGKGSPGGGLMAGGDFVVGYRVSDAEVVGRALGRATELLVAASEGQLVAREMAMGERTVHALWMGPLAMMGLEPAWVLEGEWLVVGSDAATVVSAAERFGAGEAAEGLWGSERFGKVWEQIKGRGAGEETLWVRYENSEAAMRQWMAAMRQVWAIAVMALSQEGVQLPMALPWLDHYFSRMGDSYEVTWVDEAGIRSRAKGSGPSMVQVGVAGTALGVSILLAIGRGGVGEASAVREPVEGDRGGDLRRIRGILMAGTRRSWGCW